MVQTSETECGFVGGIEFAEWTKRRALRARSFCACKKQRRYKERQTWQSGYGARARNDKTTCTQILKPATIYYVYAAIYVMYVCMYE